MLRENLEEEAVIMKDVPGWKVKAQASFWSLILMDVDDFTDATFPPPIRSAKASSTQTAG